MTQKNLGSVAAHLKSLLPTSIPEDLTVSVDYMSIASQGEIKKGLLAFRDYMERLYDHLMNDDELKDTPIKKKKKFSDETTLTVEFPFINNIKSILINIARYGVFLDDRSAIRVDEWNKLCLKTSLNKNSTSTISNAQMLKTLRFLSSTGLSILGIDLNQKKIDPSSIKYLEFSYLENQDILIGHRAFGLAQDIFSTRKNDDILLRCDYQSLSPDNEDLELVLEEFTKSLSTDLQDQLRSLHKEYLKQGMKCEIDKGFLCTQILYSIKGKMLWRFSQSYHNGFRLVMKAKKEKSYMDVVEGFSQELGNKIKAGYGCNRKSGSGHGNCQRGCEGISFPMDRKLLTLIQEIHQWQQNELKYYLG